MPLEVRDCFKPYLTDVFIETGSFFGDGIWWALHMGYKWVWSIEVHPEHHRISSQRFANDPRVKIILGDSREVFPRLLEGVNEKVTIFLDAHNSGFPQWANTDYYEMENILPVEIETIGKHRVKNHNVIIDDMEIPPSRASENPVCQDVIDRMMKVNPGYKVETLPWKDKQDYLWAFSEEKFQ